MAKKLSRRSQQRLKRMSDSIDSINKLVNRLNLADIEELIRRDEIPVTGANSGGGGSFAVARNGGKPSGSSVERAVIAKMEGRKVYDPVREQVKKIERRIIDTEENLRQIHESINAMKDGVEKKRSRQTSEPCEICMILPAVKTAMCIGCYGEWVENGAPDRFRWKAYKRMLTSAEGIPLVESPPPPRRQ